MEKAVKNIIGFFSSPGAFFDEKNFEKTENLRLKLLEKYPGLKNAPIEKQLNLATKMLNEHKLAIQKAKLFMDIMPWVVALIALLR